jgi:hypothetical protein
MTADNSVNLIKVCDQTGHKSSSQQSGSSIAGKQLSIPRVHAHAALYRRRDQARPALRGSTVMI